MKVDLKTEFLEFLSTFEKYLVIALKYSLLNLFLLITHQCLRKALWSLSNK
jgi:hypothetical protein